MKTLFACPGSGVGMLGTVLTVGCLLTLVPGPAVARPQEETNTTGKTAQNQGVPWPAMDGLGRVLPESQEVGPPRKDRYVGIFYFLWLGQHGRKDVGPFDVSRILGEDPNALATPTSPPWGPAGTMHFWAEPLYGYYLNSDPWVLRRHAHLLADAGIDTLIFDTTNAVTYKAVYMKLCEVFSEVRRQAGRTPQIVFMVNTRPGQTAEQIYHDLYEPGLYKQLWFRWQGKPLMICDPEKASPVLRQFFTLRKAHWPFEQVNTPYAWHWEAAYPQHYGYTDDPDVPEQVNVSVAQNLRLSDGYPTNMSDGNARGRSFHDGRVDRRPDAVKHGYNFAEQWQRALELDPPFVMVTGWNEWIAGGFMRKGKLVFVDQYNEEYSRDIEMMKGGHSDNYYYQLVAGVRRYKGSARLPKATAPKTITIAGGFEQWRDVGPAYEDYDSETVPRDHAGVGRLHYKNDTGRNEFLTLKVARDNEKVYFYARTRTAITPSDGSNWMMLLIDADKNSKTGWNGFEFIVNRTVTNETTAVLERYVSDWQWKGVCEIAYRVGGNQMHLAVPRAALGLPDGNGGLCFDFKWLDNVSQPLNVMDFYTDGDVAPEGRFKYRYLSEPAERSAGNKRR